MRCSNCGSEVSGKFCQKCGTASVQQVYTPPGGPAGVSPQQMYAAPIGASVGNILAGKRLFFCATICQTVWSGLYWIMSNAYLMIGYELTGIFGSSDTLFDSPGFWFSILPLCVATIILCWNAYRQHSPALLISAASCAALTYILIVIGSISEYNSSSGGSSSGGQENFFINAYSFFSYIFIFAAPVFYAFMAVWRSVKTKL